MASGSDAQSSTSSAIPPSVICAYKQPDHEKFQKIREKYHGLLDNLQNRIDESGDAGVSIDELENLLNQANLLFTDVKRPQEARLDISVMKKVLLLVKSNVEKTTSNLFVFKPVEFADKLINYTKNLYIADSHEDIENLYDLSENSFLKLDRRLYSLSTHTFGLEPIFGALDWKPPERKASQRTAMEKRPTTAQSIQKVSQPETDVEGSTDEVNRIHNILKRRCRENQAPIGFLEFAIDPTSFSKTVENIFHISFLLRDGHIEISSGKNNVPTISPIFKDGVCQNDRNQAVNQAVLNMNMTDWKEAIKLLKLQGKPPMITRRENVPNKKRTR